MMTITRGGELRQLWLPSIQIGVLTGLLLKFLFFFPPFFHWMGVIATVLFCILDRQVCRFSTSWSLATLASFPGGESLRQQHVV